MCFSIFPYIHHAFRFDNSKMATARLVISLFMCIYSICYIANDRLIIQTNISHIRFGSILISVLEKIY